MMVVEFFTSICNNTTKTKEGAKTCPREVSLCVCSCAVSTLLNSSTNNHLSRLQEKSGIISVPATSHFTENDRVHMWIPVKLWTTIQHPHTVQVSAPATDILGLRQSQTTADYLPPYSLMIRNSYLLPGAPYDVPDASCFWNLRGIGWCNWMQQTLMILLPMHFCDWGHWMTQGVIKMTQGYYQLSLSSTRISVSREQLSFDRDHS